VTDSIQESVTLLSHSSAPNGVIHHLCHATDCVQQQTPAAKTQVNVRQEHNS